MNRIYFFCFLIMVSLNSCVTHGELLLFDEGGSFPTTPESLANWEPLKIQINDVLFITVDGKNETALRPYIKQPNNNLAGFGQNPSLLGYIVDNNGEIDYPGLGTLKLAGLTSDEAITLLEQKLSEFISDFTVTLRFLNFKVSVLGEVLQQGSIPIDNERITIVEAIAQAGGLTSYGDASNILLQREIDGQRSFHTINLNDKKIFQSSLFYLKQNDVIYVQPLPQKTATVANQSRNIVPWIGVVTSAINIYLLLTRL